MQRRPIPPTTAHSYTYLPPKRPLQHTAMHCNTHCSVLQHTATLCNILQHSATPCDKLQHIATYCSTLQHSASLCTLQHTATHCNTLQHTATHCNTLQHTAAQHLQEPHLHRRTSVSVVSLYAPAFDKERLIFNVCGTRPTNDTVTCQMTSNASYRDVSNAVTCQMPSNASCRATRSC